MRLKIQGLGINCLITLLALATAAATAVAEGKLIVRCASESGEPIRNVQVSVLQQGGEPGNQFGEQKKTNKRGEATFKGVNQGIFRILARGEGYAPAFRDLYQFPGEGEVTLDLTLEAGDPETQLYFEDQELAQKATTLIQEGAQDARDKNFDAAEVKLKESLQIMPANPDALINLGLVYLGREQWEQAEETFKEAADQLAVFSQLNVAGVDERRQQVLQTIDQIPMQKLSVKSQGLMNDRKYKEAIPVIEEMRELAPDNPDLLYNLAIAQAQSEMLEEAKASVEKALEMNPDERSYQRLLQQIKDIQESGRSMAAQEAIQAIEKEYGEGNYETALQELEKVFGSLEEKYHGPLWILKARSHAQLSQHDPAIAAYQKAIELNPDIALGLKEELAQTYINAEKYQEGIALYAEVFEGKSEDPAPKFFDMAQSFSRKGQAGLAAQLFQRVLEIDPDFPEAYFELGVHYFYETQEKDKAKEMFERYLEIGESQENKDNARAILAVIEKSK
ncbi:MAG TPA: tetratricopeptide repeat protein [Acidobacteriota bacterium]|nr:tetratricopeptide repeat protein [Acidobacteriota bacterium]